MKTLGIVLFVLLLVGCQQRIEGSYYQSSSASEIWDTSGQNGNHQKQRVFVEVEVLTDLADDGLATVVIEVNDENIRSKNLREIKRLVENNRNQILKTLASNDIKVLQILDDGRAFTAEINSAAIEILRASEYVESIKIVRVITPKR